MMFVVGLQMNPPTNAAMMHSSMASPSTRRWVDFCTGWKISDQATSSVCPAESRITGYLRCRMDSATISPMSRNSPASMARSMYSVYTLSGASTTVCLPSAIQAPSRARASAIIPAAAA